MLISVKDRMKEIGIRRALGATDFSIIKLILSEAAFLTFLSGYIGLLVATSLLYVTQKILSMNTQPAFFRDPEIHLPTVILAILLLVLTGVLAGLIPAMKAIRVPPVKAIKL